jgi:hypothetical protein
MKKLQTKDTGTPRAGGGETGPQLPYVLPRYAVPQKFFGNGPPGVVPGNLPGDIYLDELNHQEYICSAPQAKGAPACSVVAPGDWSLLTTSSAPGGATGPAGGDLVGTYPDPVVAQASGPTFDVAGTLNASGPLNGQSATLQGSLTVDLTADVKGSLTVEQTVDVKGALTVEQTATVTGVLNILASALFASGVSGVGEAVTGDVMCVGDASNPVPGSPLAGGGNTPALVWYNGTTWMVFAV